MLNLVPVGRLIIAADQAYYRGVICKLDYGVYINKWVYDKKKKIYIIQRESMISYDFLCSCFKNILISQKTVLRFASQVNASWFKDV